MTSTQHALSKVLGVSLTITLVVAFAIAQQPRGSLRGLITDELGAAIVGANVTLTESSGAQKRTTTNGEGIYIFSALAPGKYVLLAVAPGFASSGDKEEEINGQRQSLDLTLRVTIEEKVTIAAEAPLSTDATNNANQTVISGPGLDPLPDDPDELAAALQALPGPPLRPNCGQY